MIDKINYITCIIKCITLLLCHKTNPTTKINKDMRATKYNKKSDYEASVDDVPKQVLRVHLCTGIEDGLVLRQGGS